MDSRTTQAAANQTVTASLDGRVALVTGGARGIGAAVARSLVAAGGRVVVADVLDVEGKATVEPLGDAAAFTRLDVTEPESWQQAVAFTEAQFGPLSVLVNNAGIVDFGGIEQTSRDSFWHVLDVNLVGQFLGMKSCIASLRQGREPVIINISSTAGLIGYAGIAAYVASKWGIRGLTKAAALELAADHIRVVSVHPGPIRTPMTAGMGDETVTAQPIARFGEPDEVAAMVRFLAAEASFSTGSEFVVDGGAVAGTVLPLPQ
jgi:3alpha(or 20beta)-hydroxysteroid dehydrogenase